METANNAERVVALGSDHAGFALKEAIKGTLTREGWRVIDAGTYSDESCDYPIYARRLCGEITSGAAPLGILVCGTGIGMSIAANKVRGIRAACCSDTFSAAASRAHNDANVLCIGQRVVGDGLATDLVRAFLTTPFAGGRHARRVGLIEG